MWLDDILFWSHTPLSGKMMIFSIVALALAPIVSAAFINRPGVCYHEKVSAYFRHYDNGSLGHWKQCEGGSVCIQAGEDEYFCTGDGSETGMYARPYMHISDGASNMPFSPDELPSSTGRG